MRIALGMLAFAYLAALARSDWAKASQVLSVFQVFLRQEAAVVAAAFPAAAQDRVRTAFRAVEPSARFDSATREGLIAALMVGWRNEPALLTSMPVSAAQLGEWYRNKLLTQAPRGDMLAADVLVQNTLEPDVSNALMEATSAYLAGRTTQTSGSAGEGTFQSLLDNLMGRGGADVSDAPVVRGSEIDVGRTQSRTPSWMLWGVGLGVVAAGGLLIWGFMGKRS